MVRQAGKGLRWWEGHGHTRPKCHEHWVMNEWTDAWMRDGSGQVPYGQLWEGSWSEGGCGFIFPPQDRGQPGHLTSASGGILCSPRLNLPGLTPLPCPHCWVTSPYCPPYPALYFPFPEGTPSLNQFQPSTRHCLHPRLFIQTFHLPPRLTFSLRATSLQPSAQKAVPARTAPGSQGRVAELYLLLLDASAPPPSCHTSCFPSTSLPCNPQEHPRPSPFVLWSRPPLIAPY